MQKEIPTLIGMNKIISINCYIKIEKNGIEIKNKFLDNRDLLMMSINYNKYKYKNGNIIEAEIIEIRTKKNDLIFSFNKKDIIKINDKFSNDGKLTIIINKGKDKIIIFISKSTKELIDSFTNKLTNNNNNENNIKIKSNLNNSENIFINNIKNKKRQYHQQYAKIHNKNKINLKQNLNPNKIEPEKNEIFITLNDFPDYLTFIIFDYLDKKTLLSKISLLNHQIKSYCDYYINSTIIRDDTPNEIFNKILIRFKNSKQLIFGKAKNFKNQNIKNLNGNLKQLEFLDISQIENLNDYSIRSLFSRTKIEKITTLKLNFYLECLYSALIYIFEFYKNLNNLYILKNFDFTKQNLSNLSKFPKYYHNNIFKILNRILISKEHKINKLNIFIYNCIQIENNEIIFKNLIELNIDLLLISEIKNLKIFYFCNNIKNFKIGEIAIKNFEKNEPNLNFIEFNNNYDMNQLEQIDFDNDYIEIFSKIFFYMKNVEFICFGNFLNDEICKIISIYCKKLEGFNFKSKLITDEGIKLILQTNKNTIKEINLMECSRFLGNCFFELNNNNEFPINLNKAIFSISTHNFYHVINFLRNKNVKAQNYIKISNKQNIN